ncbi:MAG TPA: glycosyltransferase, partial [Desulfosporosinus sp.]|nr:glycosyltransferase [Desulfosporosinus sp.]
TDETGIRVPAYTPKQVVKDMAEAMRRLAEDVETRKNMGLAGRERVKRDFTWEKKGMFFNKIYNEHGASKKH